MNEAGQVSEWCEPEQMTLVAIPAPDPKSGEVRIRNHAAALNFFDILQIQGKYQTKPPLPFTPGKSHTIIKPSSPSLR